MKRFGLRALAGTLATLMVVSAFGPAKAASAADDILLIAPNPNALKTLYITEDMVDEDGEIVISGGSYDRVVVAKEVAAKDIYFDQVTVGEMVVESGGASRIQLWEVDAEQVTVQEPELEALTLTDLKDLLADQETRAAALQMYIESHAKDEKTKQTAPTIVTKEDAAVESFVARANATLDLAEGEVGIVALEGSEKVDRAKVTLKNYKGDVSFKGSEGKSNMTLNNVDSRINTLKVEESDANDYFMVNAKDSVVIKAEVDGNANFSLNALTGALEVTENATAANVTLLNTIEEMNIAGNGATVDVAPCARVEKMDIAGNDAKVTGSGTLVEADITGKGAYVSTYGSKVKGENTYVPPVYVEPVVDPYDTWSEDFSDAEINANLAQNMNGAKYTYNAEGYGVASSAKGWEGFSVTLDNKDNGSAAEFVISMKVKMLGGTANELRMTTPPGCSASYMKTVAVSNEWITITSDKISVPAGGKIDVIVAPTNNDHTLELAVDDVMVKRYTEWSEPQARPVVTENKVFTFTKSDLSIYSYNIPVSYDVNENNALVMKTNDKYQAVVFTLPELVNAADYSKLKVYLTATSGEVTVKVWRKGEAGSGGNPATINYSALANPNIDLGGIYGDEIDRIEIASNGTGEATITVEKLEFVAAGGSQGGNGGNQNTTPEGGIKCGPVTEWEIQIFKEHDLRKYAGTSVTFTVDMIRVGGTEDALVHAQLNNSINYITNEKGEATGSYTGLGWDVAIKDTWQTLTYTYDVPEEFGDDAHAAKDPIYFGFRTKSNTTDYTPYTFYYKNYKFVGTPAVQEKPGETILPAENIVYNFENGIGMVSGNGATATQAAPAKTGNSVWKQISDGGYAAGTIATKLPDGKTLTEMASVRFDYYIVTEGVQYKPVKVFIGSALENSEAVWNDAYVNTPDTSTNQDFTNGQTWGVCTTALDATKVSALGLAAGANITLGIGMMYEGATYYIDNVRLVDTAGNEYLLEDFEGTAPAFGVVNWGVESSVSNTVDLSAYGESMVQVTNSGWGQGIKFSFTLPEGKTIADYKGLQMNVFLPADAVPVDTQDFTFKDLRVAAGTGDYVALPEGTDYVGWESKGNVGSWVLVDVANWDTLVTAIGEATTFNIAVGVNTPCQTPYYIDNVVLMAK